FAAFVRLRRCVHNVFIFAVVGGTRFGGDRRVSCSGIVGGGVVVSAGLRGFASGIVEFESNAVRARVGVEIAGAQRAAVFGYSRVVAGRDLVAGGLSADQGANAIACAATRCGTASAAEARVFRYAGAIFTGVPAVKPLRVAADAAVQIRHSPTELLHGATAYRRVVVHPAE